MARNNAIKIHNTLEYEVKRKSINRGMVTVHHSICDEPIDAVNEYISICKKAGKTIPKKADVQADVIHKVKLCPPVKEFIDWCIEKGYYEISEYIPNAEEVEEDF